MARQVYKEYNQGEILLFPPSIESMVPQDSPAASFLLNLPKKRNMDEIKNCIKKIAEYKERCNDAELKQTLESALFYLGNFQKIMEIYADKPDVNTCIQRLHKSTYDCIGKIHK